MFQFLDRAKGFNLITPGVLSADSTLVEADLTGYECADIHLQTGVGGITFDTTNKIEFKLTKAPVAGGTYIDAVAADVVLPAGFTMGASGIIRALTSAKAAWEDFLVAYVGGPAYPCIKLLADFSGTHGTGTAIAAFVAAYRGRLNPPV